MPTAWAFGKTALPRIVFIVALRAGSASPRVELLIDRRVVGKRKKDRSGSSQCSVLLKYAHGCPTLQHQARAFRPAIQVSQKTLLKCVASLG
jgi:hypothetical protein